MIHILTRDHFSLRYTIEGNGSPALVIGSHVYYPRTFSQNLKLHLQMIFMDHRGFCPTDERDTEEDFTLSKLLEDIHALQESLGHEKIILIGHSIHALIALEYTKKYPDKVSKLILIAASPINGPKLHEACNRSFEESVCPERKELFAHSMKTLPEKVTKDPDRTFITHMLSFGPMLWFDPIFDARPLWESVALNATGVHIIWEEMFNHYDITQNMENI